MSGIIGSMQIQELGPEQTFLTYRVLLGLRPFLGSKEEFVETINGCQRLHGYRLAGLFLAILEEPVAVVGFRENRSLAWGKHLYVDDLVTLPSHRGKGYGASLLDWVVDEARRLGYREVHLDSGTQRHDAHRLYLSRRLEITSFHFALRLE